MNNKLCNSSWPDGVISRGLITCLAMVTSFMYWYDFWTALVVSANDDHIVDNALKTHSHDAPAFLAHFTPSLSLCFTLKSQFVVYSFTSASLAHFTPSLSHSVLSSKTNLWCIVFAPFSPTNQKLLQWFLALCTCISCYIYHSSLSLSLHFSHCNRLCVGSLYSSRGSWFTDPSSWNAVPHSTKFSLFENHGHFENHQSTGHGAHRHMGSNQDASHG